MSSVTVTATTRGCSKCKYYVCAPAIFGYCNIPDSLRDSMFDTVEDSKQIIRIKAYGCNAWKSKKKESK